MVKKQITIHKKNTSENSTKVSVILLDWSCRERFHALEWLNNQNVPRIHGVNRLYALITDHNYIGLPITEDDLDFIDDLEVHHTKPLAEGGEDTVNNAEALCPNCHKEAHYG